VKISHVRDNCGRAFALRAKLRMHVIESSAIDAAERTRDAQCAQCNARRMSSFRAHAPRRGDCDQFSA